MAGCLIAFTAFEEVGVQFPKPSCLLTISSTRGYNTLFGVHGYKACTWCTHIHASKTFIHVKKIKIQVKVRWRRNKTRISLMPSPLLSLSPSPPPSSTVNWTQHFIQPQELYLNPQDSLKTWQQFDCLHLLLKNSVIDTWKPSQEVNRCQDERDGCIDTLRAM